MFSSWALGLGLVDLVASRGLVGAGGGGEAGSAAWCIYLVLNILVRRRKMELRPVINFYSSVFSV